MRNQTIIMFFVLFAFVTNAHSIDTIVKKDSVIEIIENQNQYNGAADLDVDFGLIEDKLDSLISKINNIHQKLEEKSVFVQIIPILVALLAGLIALLQVKANIISTARVEWTQNLRNNISSFLAETEILNYNLREVLELNKQGNSTQAEALYKAQTENFKKVHNYGNQILLFLNNKKESQQKELQQLVVEYLNKSTHGKYSTEVDKLDELQKDIISKSQDILKQAWEDAKTFKLTDIFKFRI